MSDYQKSVSNFLKTDHGQQLLEELMDIIVAAAVERIASEEARRAAVAECMGILAHDSSYCEDES